MMYFVERASSAPALTYSISCFIVDFRTANDRDQRQEEGRTTGNKDREKGNQNEVERDKKERTKHVQ